MRNLPVRTGYATLAAVVVLLATDNSQAEVFTTFQFTRIGRGNQVIAIPTTYYLVPRYRPPASRRGPETWLVRLRNRNTVFTRSYRVPNSGLAIRQAKREYPSASLLAVRKQ